VVFAAIDTKKHRLSGALAVDPGPSRVCDIKKKSLKQEKE